jgi:hypothetical protein
MLIIWHGRGWWVTWIAALAMFLPIIVLRQVDGPEIDRALTVTMIMAALATAGLGLRFNRGATFGPAAQQHSLWGIPMQFWALPMALFALALGAGWLTTAEEPRPRATTTQSEAPAR